MKNIAVVAMNTKNVPYVSGHETIFTLNHQKVWYTPNVWVISIPFLIKINDSILNYLIKNLFKRSTKHDLLLSSYFINQVALVLNKEHFDEIIFENDELKNKVQLKMQKRSKPAFKLFKSQKNESFFKKYPVSRT